MSVTKYFQIVNVTIPSSWVAVLLAFVVTYFMVRIKFGREAAHLIGDSMFYFLIVWKFSVVLTDFKTVIQFPLSLLYFNGGTIGVYLGIGAVMINLYWVHRKRVIIQSEKFSLLMSGIIILSTYQLLMALFNEGPLFIRILTIVLMILLILSMLFFTEQFQTMPKELVLLGIGLHLFVSAWQPAGILQTSTIALIVLSSLLLFALQIVQKEARS